jgi:hypothetical protein
MIYGIDISHTALNSIVTNRAAEATTLILEISGSNAREARGMTTSSGGRVWPYLQLIQLNSVITTSVSASPRL